MIMNNFQDRLQDLLIENNLNRHQLSTQLGIPVSTINGYFSNNYYPTIEIAQKLADYFKCSLDYLFGLSDTIKSCEKSNKTFFEKLDKAIKDKKVPIAKAMRDMCMSEYNYYRWRNGKFPKTSNLIEIAKYFDISVDYLVGDLLIK